MSAPEPPSGERPDATESVLVADVPERGRFEISVDGVPAGFTEYVDEQPGDAVGVRTFPHTVVAPEFGGRGLATLLIRTALDSTRAKGLEVVPACPAVRRFIAKHPEYADLVPADRRGDLGP